jgi:hypothetical protein
MDPLLLQFRDNGRGHDDLYLWLETYSRTADSYYLALDPEFEPRDETPDKVRRVLVKLLESWTTALSQASTTNPAYLPYDFSDQYTGCLRCQCHEGFVDITPGWSHREGWSVSPSNPGDYLFGVKDFTCDAPNPIRLALSEFVRRIRDSILAVEARPKST